MSIQSTHRPGRPRPALSRRALLAGTAAGAVGLSLAACGKGKKVGSQADSKTVTVVTHDSFHVSENLQKAFTSETGYTLKIATSGDAGALVNKLVLTKDAPLGDAVFGIDNTYATRALDQGVIDTSATVTLPKGAESYVVADTPALAPIDVGDVCLNIDTGYFTGKGLTPPATFEDLTKPEYKGLFVAINPTNSSPGMAWLLATIGHFGAGSFADYWKQLMANGARIAEDWSAAYETDFSGSGKGTYPIVVSYASSPSFTVSKDKSSSSTSALLDTAFRQVEYAGVLKGAANPEGGKAFVEWMLSKAVQEDIPGQMYMYPVLPDAALPETLTKFGQPLREPTPEPPGTLSPPGRPAGLGRWPGCKAQQRSREAARSGPPPREPAGRAPAAPGPVGASGPAGPWPSSARWPSWRSSSPGPWPRSWAAASPPTAPWT